MTRKRTAREVALHLLRVRPRTRKELRQRLQGKGFPEEKIEEVIQELQNTGLLDEQEFAEAFVLGKVRKLYSRSWIFKALMKAGVTEAMATRVLEELYSDEDVYRGLLQHAQEVASRVRDPEKAKRRIYNFILRRGHSASLAYQILREIYGKV